MGGVIPACPIESSYTLYLCRLQYLTVILYFTVTLAHLYVNGTYAHLGFMNQTRHSLQV